MPRTRPAPASQPSLERLAIKETTPVSTGCMYEAEVQDRAVNPVVLRGTAEQTLPSIGPLRDCLRIASCHLKAR